MDWLGIRVQNCKGRQGSKGEGIHFTHIARVAEGLQLVTKHPICLRTYFELLQEYESVDRLYYNRRRFLLIVSVLPIFKRTSSDADAIAAANICPGRALVRRTSDRILIFNFSASTALKSGSCECEVVTLKSSLYKYNDKPSICNLTSAPSFC